MRVLIEAHHPAHVHFWKYPIRELQRRGHEVLLIGRDRDVMRRLLEVYDWIPSIIPPRESQRNRFPLLEMLQRQWLVAKQIRHFRPDVVASLMGSYTQTAKVLGVRNVVFTDSEFQHFNHRIAHPFADVVYTPECFYKDLGRKQSRYRGIHELMFLRKELFQPNEEMLSAFDYVEPGRYIVLRFSAWNTLHDIGQRGVGTQIFGIIKEYADKYRFVLSAEEAQMLPELKPYVLKVQPEHMHDLLYFSAFVVSEGASTASEAACLGVPTVYINSTEERGYLRMLEQDFGILSCHRDASAGLARVREEIEKIGKPDWEARERLRLAVESAHPDGIKFVVEALEKEAS